MSLLHRLPALMLVLGVAAASLRADADQPHKKNVLLIISDDLNVSLGCYGHPLVKSPNVDALAARGVRFEHAYCQFPLCNPSRCSFMSGRRPDTTQIFNNATSLRKTLPDVVTLPQHFMNAGYFAGRVGKIYHYNVPGQIGTSGLDDPASWNQVINPRGRDKDEEADVIDFTPQLHNIGGSLTWLKTGGTGEDHTDGKVADAVIGMLESHRDKPFFIACGFYRPHVPCAASENYFALYPIEQIRLPIEPPDHIAHIPPIALTCKPLNYGVSPENLRTFTRAYYASTSLMDAQLGRVLAALDRLKLTDNTIIAFISDHGWSLGNHGQWQKMLLFEESVQVPMIIVDPAHPNPGKHSGRIVELLDLYPTLAELAGLGPPPGAEGYSLAPLLNNPDADWSHPAYSQVTRGGRMGRSVRTEQYRFTEWDGGSRGVELYDHQTDPHEFNNLALDPASAAVLAQMKSLLHAQHQ